MIPKAGKNVKSNLKVKIRQNCFHHNANSVLLLIKCLLWKICHIIQVPVPPRFPPLWPTKSFATCTYIQRYPDSNDKMIGLCPTRCHRLGGGSCNDRVLCCTFKKTAMGRRGWGRLVVQTPKIQCLCKKNMWEKIWLADGWFRTWSSNVIEKCDLIQWQWLVFRIIGKPTQILPNFNTSWKCSKRGKYLPTIR